MDGCGRILRVAVEDAFIGHTMCDTRVVSPATPIEAVDTAVLVVHSSGYTRIQTRQKGGILVDWKLGRDKPQS